MARRRRPFARPTEVGPVELTIFVLAPAVPSLVFGQFGDALQTIVYALALLALLWFAASYGLWSLISWAWSRSIAQVPLLLSVVARGLPLLLLFSTFLFINAEVWQVAADLPTGTLWLTALLFVLLATGFLLVRLPEEVDKVDDEVDADFLRRTTDGTPMAEAARALLAEGGTRPAWAAYAEVRGFERWNLVLVLVVIQAVQVLLLSVGVFVFFLAFGGLVMDVGVQSSWTGIAESDVHTLPVLSQLTIPLVQVSVFLASFSALYLTVSTVTDETYRVQFFGSVMRELERAVGVRAVYLALRERGATLPA